MLNNNIVEEENNKKRKAYERKKASGKDQPKADDEENIPERKQYSLSANTIKHWIEAYLKIPLDKQREYQATGKDKSKGCYGGCHNFKMTDDALTCLICLALDFPNMQIKHFTSYLNSKFGPCYHKKVKDSTVHCALRSLKFSVKKAAFCPPARNTIGSRIFRVAWSLFMDEISNQNDVLIGFIDEAGVGIGEGSKYGHSFIGITPLINSTLSNCQVSVLACVVPGFGVLYKYYNSSVIGKDYASFLEDITAFLRIYVCSSNS